MPQRIEEQVFPFPSPLSSSSGENLAPKRILPFHYFFSRNLWETATEGGCTAGWRRPRSFSYLERNQTGKKLLVTHEHFSFCPFSSERHMGKGIYSTFEFRFFPLRSKDWDRSIWPSLQFLSRNLEERERRRENKRIQISAAFSHVFFFEREIVAFILRNRERGKCIKTKKISPWLHFVAPRRGFSDFQSSDFFLSPPPFSRLCGQLARE